MSVSQYWIQLNPNLIQCHKNTFSTFNLIRLLGQVISPRPSSNMDHGKLANYLLTHGKYILSTHPSDAGSRGIRHVFVPDKPRLVSLVYFSKVPETLGEESNAAHTLIRCIRRWTGRTHPKNRATFNSLDLVPRMLEFPVSWEAVVAFVETVMSLKEEAGDLNGRGGGVKSLLGARCERCRSSCFLRLTDKQILFLRWTVGAFVGCDGLPHGRAFRGIVPVDPLPL